MKYQGMIAACGMNCGLCIGHLRTKNPCGGCFKIDDPNKPNACRSCKIVNCPELKKSQTGFCFECDKYPCLRLKNLDKRYRTKYGMSMLENLASIKEIGLEEFIKSEEKRWACPNCGAGLCVHRDFCLECKQAV
jgi:hypothetical protein